MAGSTRVIFGRRSMPMSATLGALLALAAMAFSPVVGRAQVGGGASPPTIPAAGVPRLSDGHPDLSGVWWRGSDIGLRPLAADPDSRPARGTAPPAARGAAPPAQRTASFASLYQPWAMEKKKTLGDKDDPSLRCAPVAFGTLNVSLFGVGAVGQIVHTPAFVVMLIETYHSFRIIPTDGRKHRDDAPPSYHGDSVGHWEGDTLVVDQTNFTDSNWMAAEGIVSFHSDALHIVERYRRLDANRLEVEATVEDPKVLTGPWKVPAQTLQLAPFDQIMEVGCSGTETAGLMEAASKQNYGKK